MHRSIIVTVITADKPGTGAVIHLVVIMEIQQPVHLEAFNIDHVVRAVMWKHLILVH